jgi:hypothetical protein
LKVLCWGHIEAENIREAIHHAEQKTNVNRLFDGLVTHPHRPHRFDIFRAHLTRGNGQFFQEAQCPPQLLIHWSRPPILQDRRHHLIIAYAENRNCGVSVNSILALIKSGNKGGEELYFSQRPLARFTHPFLITSGKVFAA